MAGPHYQDPGPGAHAFVITPSDSADLARRTRGIYVGVSGDLTVHMAEDGQSILFKDLAAGIVHPIAVIRVLSAGTSASSLLGMF